MKCDKRKKKIIFDNLSIWSSNSFLNISRFLFPFLIPPIFLLLCFYVNSNTLSPFKGETCLLHQLFFYFFIKNYYYYTQKFFQVPLENNKTPHNHHFHLAEIFFSCYRIRLEIPFKNMWEKEDNFFIFCW